VPQIIDLRNVTVPSTRLVPRRDCALLARGIIVPAFEATYARPWAARLSDGRLAFVAIPSAKLLLVQTGHEPVEAILQQSGRGMLTGATAVELSGDSLLVFASQAQQGFVYSLQGSVVRHFMLKPPSVGGVETIMVGTIDMPRRVVLLERAVRPRTGTGAAPDSLRILWSEVGGRVLAQSPELANGFVVRDPQVVVHGTPGTGALKQMVIKRVAAGSVVRVRSVAVGRRLVYHFDEGADAVDAFDAGGVRVRRLLLPRLVDTLRPGPGRTTPMGGAQLLDLFVDDADRLWVEMPRLHVSDERSWWIISQNGRFVGAAATPGDAAVLSVQTDSVVLAPRNRGDKTEVTMCPWSKR
jgi:hypothetical protein